MGRIDILPRDREIVVSLLERFLPEIEVRAFGSRVSRNARRHSDLDLVLMTEIPLDIRTLARLRGAFSESALPFKVDILDWSLLD